MRTKIEISERLNIPLYEVDMLVEGLILKECMYWSEDKGYCLTEKGKKLKDKDK